MEVIIKNEMSSYKGYIVENFVAQELFFHLDKDLVSWTEGQSEIEFMIVKEELIVPIEVKSATRSRSAKSLTAYINRYHPQMAYKLSGQNVGKTPTFTTLPLYLCEKIS